MAADHSHPEEPSGKEMELAGDFDSRRAIMSIELAIDVLHVRAHRIDGDDQLARNLGVGATRNKQAQDTQLLRTQRLGQERGRRWSQRAFPGSQGTQDALKIRKVQVARVDAARGDARESPWLPPHPGRDADIPRCRCAPAASGGCAGPALAARAPRRPGPVALEPQRRCAYVPFPGPRVPDPATAEARPRFCPGPDASVQAAVFLVRSRMETAAHQTAPHQLSSAARQPDYRLPVPGGPARSAFRGTTARRRPAAWRVSWQAAPPGEAGPSRSRRAHVGYEPAAGSPAPRETPARETGRWPTPLPPAARPCLAHCVHRRCVPGHISHERCRRYGRIPLRPGFAPPGNTRKVGAVLPAQTTPWQACWSWPD